MANYEFVVGNPGVEFVENFERSLFHQNEHLFLQADSGWLNFYIVNSDRSSAEAYLPIHVEGTKATSPFKSPFGSICFSKGLSPEVLQNFIIYIESELKRVGIKEILIQNPPVAYQPQNLSLFQVLLINCGFTISKAEVTSVVYVDSKSFYSKIKPQQQQRLKHAKLEGLEFVILDTNNLCEVYELINNWQLARGFNLSMSIDGLSKVVEKFTQEFIISIVKQKQEVVAAAISIKVTKNVIYNFYLSHNPEYNHLSPVLLLLEGLYTYCQQHSFLLFDLGTSSLSGKPNFRLLNFKRRMGSEYSSKFAFYKALHA